MRFCEGVVGVGGVGDEDMYYTSSGVGVYYLMLLAEKKCYV